MADPYTRADVLRVAVAHMTGAEDIDNSAILDDIVENVTDELDVIEAVDFLRDVAKVLGAIFQGVREGNPELSEHLVHQLAIRAAMNADI